MRPRILVLYGTTDGHTGKVAAAIANTLRAERADVELIHARPGGSDPMPEAFTAVIVAASVHTNGYQRAVWRWVRRHAAGLHGKPTAFVSVCLGVLERTPAADAELSNVMEGFFAATSWSPTIRKVVAGALPYTRYSWFKRLVVRRVVRNAYGPTDPSRDYEYTDWNDVRDFARLFARLAEDTQPTPVAV